MFQFAEYCWCPNPGVRGYGPLATTSLLDSRPTAADRTDAQPIAVVSFCCTEQELRI
jgi:hypothetical protein